MVPRMARLIPSSYRFLRAVSGFDNIFKPRINVTDAMR
jgi:hypothetical protein